MKGRSVMGVILIAFGVVLAINVFNNGGKSPLSGLSSIFAREEVRIGKTVDVSTVDRIDLKAGSTNIEFVKGSSEQAVVELKGRASKSRIERMGLKAEQTGSTLHIAIDQTKSFYFGFFWSDLTLVVELPEKMWDDVNVKVGSGNITLGALQTESLAVSTGSGNVRADAIDTQQFEVKVSSGNIKVADIVSGKIELAASSGNIEAERYRAESMNVKTSSGNLTFRDGVSVLTAKTNSGNIIIDADDLIRDTDLHTSSGNVNISLVRNPESLAVKYRGGSGNGTIRKKGFEYDNRSKDNDSIDGAFGSGWVKLNVRTNSGNFTLK